ncbi:LacI family DNA-binding transcriptional regulator [Georgenia subflava]|uniref:LacI family DNA-binding transcriptional regulator n=1 Tax=Georgenia subflava TaxID=1622177 RepID=A0A6N7EEM5_9MICO|nr:LacI family DNA-binding transcriptional regulator [Georgenia subflava]MPV36480.1 LacI family DNA-binding transcriptional regulator [Georgenia subflava]
MAVNLRDVARRAGVSTPTASRVLSGSDYPVAPELRERVEQAARELDYVPNAQAQALLRGNPRTVGVLVGEVDDPYFSEIVNGIQAVATTHHLLVTICNTKRDIDRELEYFRLLQAHRTGVVIIAGSGLIDDRYTEAMTARTRSFQQSGGRVVAIGDPLFDVDRVLVDNAPGARELGAHLVGLGHRDVAMLAGAANVASTVERVAGLREAVERAGGTLHVRHGSPTRDGGWSGAAEVLAAHPEVTALVGSADQMAIGALAHLRAQGRAVPGEVSVAGFNDIAIAKDLEPSLTTVRLPLQEMGRSALELATTPAPDEEYLVRTLATELVVRRSTAAARDRA